MKKMILLLVGALISVTPLYASIISDCSAMPPVWCSTQITTSGQCLYVGNTVTVTGIRYDVGDWDTNIDERIQFSYNGNSNSWQTVSNGGSYTFSSFPGQHIYVRYGAKELTPGMGAPYNQWVNSSSIRIDKCGVLGTPITSFNAIWQGKHTVLDWTIGINNMYQFRVERSMNGRDFTAVNSINAVIGNTDYRSYDTLRGYTGSIFYRLQAQDLGGTWTQSDVVRISTTDQVPKFLLGPNPTSGVVNVQPPAGIKFMIQVCDMAGRPLKPDATQYTGNGQIDLSGLKRGVYMIQFFDPQTKQRLETQKIVRQ